LNQQDKNTSGSEKIFNVTEQGFAPLALDIFQFQYLQNPLYRQYCDSIRVAPDAVTTLQHIPFLPIQFFKTHVVATTDFKPEAVFESSGTTSSISSKHYISSLELYEKSFSECFTRFYGNPYEWCILALLPSYLERENSSLVYMVNHLIRKSANPHSSFYLNDYKKLAQTIQLLEKAEQKTLLIGVTYALLDFAAAFPMPLKHTTLLETGGMKGRGNELTRQALHEVFTHQFKTQNIHSEYGMTELLSQAYAKEAGIFFTPPWMKVMIRAEDDPFAVHPHHHREKISGAINIIDLANLYSCSFIATDDAGILHPSGGFEVLGRLDNSDIRGCSLLSL
jgi:hypothetical protein